MIAERTYQNWQALFKEGVKHPESEADYLELAELMDDLTSDHDVNQQPWSDLFGLIAGYMHAWELKNEPELKNPEVSPHKMLAYLMDERGLTQYQLAKEGFCNQGNLSRILSGKTGISKDLAKKFAGHFGVSVELFI